MRNALHVICHPDPATGLLRGLKQLSPVLFRSECWRLHERHHADLIGGNLYFHDKYTEDALFVGRILNIDRCLPETGPKGWAFRIRKLPLFEQRWRGSKPSLYKWHGGIVVDDGPYGRLEAA